jgi:tetratricopeptide (TPR) repeat protein
METRDLLLLIGFLRAGKMFPVAVAQRGLPAPRSLRLLFAFIAEEEHRLFGPPAVAGMVDPPTERDELRARAALTAWSGDYLQPNLRIGEVPDPGVLLCLLYEGPAADAALPIDVFAQTLRRFALRDPAMRARLDEHLDQAGTFVPPWLDPALRRQRSQEAFERAMKTAREQGFAAAAPLFEAVRGDCFAPAQIAVALHERGVGDVEGALSRLDEVVRVAPRNVAARMQRAQLLAQDPARAVDAAGDWLQVLRERARASFDASASTADGSAPVSVAPMSEAPASREVQEAAAEGLWALCREYGDPQQRDAAVALAKADPPRGFEAVSRYVHTHPCAWDAQLLLASLALARQSFDLTIKLLVSVRWLFPGDPNPHFVYGQALAVKGDHEAAVQAFGHAAALAPDDADIAHWLAFSREKLAPSDAGSSAGVALAHHVTRTLLLLVGFVRGGRTYPSALVLRKVSGDVSLGIVLSALAAQEQRRFGDGSAPVTGEIDVAAAAERAVLLDYAGARLSADQLVGDVPDPGVLIALLYDAPPARDPSAPPPAEVRAGLLTVARVDREIAGKLDKHLASPEATLMGRLELR